MQKKWLLRIFCLIACNYQTARRWYTAWVSLRIQSEYWKIRTRNNSVFGHFSRSDIYCLGELKFDWLMMKYSFLFTWWFNLNFITVIWQKQVNLTFSWRRPLSYRNQSIDFLCKSIDWFLNDNGLRHEKVKFAWTITLVIEANQPTKWAHHIRSYSFDCLFRNLGCIKLKFGQILVQTMTDITIWSLHQAWILETSSRLFMILIK